MFYSQLFGGITRNWKEQPLKDVGTAAFEAIAPKWMSWDLVSLGSEDKTKVIKEVLVPKVMQFDGRTGQLQNEQDASAAQRGK